MHLDHRLAPLAVLLAITATVANAEPQNPPSPGERAVEYRKAIYEVMGWNFRPMVQMAQAKAPYDAAEFARRAERVAAVAPLLLEAFPPESEGVVSSKLKPAMWSNRADFDAKLKTLLERTGELAAVAKTGDFEKSKAAWIATANACKACHEKYRAE